MWVYFAEDSFATCLLCLNLDSRVEVAGSTKVRKCYCVGHPSRTILTRETYTQTSSSRTFFTNPSSSIYPQSSGWQYFVFYTTQSASVTEQFYFSSNGYTLNAPITLPSQLLLPTAFSGLNSPSD